MDFLQQLIDYEDGRLSNAERVKLFADLVKTGFAWQLQGSYGRAALDLIRAGVLSLEGEVLRDLGDLEG